MSPGATIGEVMRTDRPHFLAGRAIGAGEGEPAEAFLRFLLGGVAFAAGITGALLVAVPGSTARWFSWGLEPQPLASLIGGSYVASAFVFGHALGKGWKEVRGLAAGTLALTIPILVVTFTHLDVFDFGRWQARAWVFLFIASPVSFGAVVLLRRGLVVPSGPILSSWARALAALLAVVFIGAAISLWWDPARASNALPFFLPPLGGRVLGCWTSFLAFLAGWSALRGRWEEARIPLLGLAAFAVGALAGSIRNFGELEPPGKRWSYLLVLLVLLVVTSGLAARGHSVRDLR